MLPLLLNVLGCNPTLDTGVHPERCGQHRKLCPPPKPPAFPSPEVLQRDTTVLGCSVGLRHSKTCTDQHLHPPPTSPRLASEKHAETVLHRDEKKKKTVTVSVLYMHFTQRKKLLLVV